MPNHDLPAPQETRTTTWSSVLLAVLASVFGVTAYHTVRPNNETNPSTSETTATKQKAESTRELGPLHLSPEAPLYPLRDFEATSVGPEAMLWHHQSFHVSKCLIATVPDPVDSHFGFMFDQLIEQFNHAALDSGYIIDRYWLPWDIDRTVEREGIPPNGEHVQFGRLHSYQREKFPGVLLFRKADASNGDSPLVIFLVGENPTTGIDKQTFTKALQLRQKNLIIDDPEHASEVKVVGPVFSGSQKSLTMAMNAWFCVDPKTQFNVISGSASGIQVSKRCDGTYTFEGLQHAECPPRFSATVAPTKELLKWVLNCLVWKNRATAKKLSELDTQSVREALGYRKIAILEEMATSFGDLSEVEIVKDLVHIPFPMHISRVKAAYNKEQKEKDDQLGLSGMNQLAGRFGKLPEEDADTVPSQDKYTTALSTARLLQDMSAQIIREQIAYVGIVASDPRDRIFLASWLREYCPGVQLFILDNDNLLTLPEYAYYLKGTLIASTYPLIPSNQSWTGNTSTSHTICTFPNQTAEGTYNACLFHLGWKDLLREYRPPSFEKDGSQEKPPVWITMIDQQGGLVPIQYFPDSDSNGYVRPSGNPAASKEAHTAPFSLNVMIIWAALAGLCCFVLWAYHSTEPPKLFFQGSHEAYDSGEGRLYFGVFFGCLILLLEGLLVLYICHLFSQATDTIYRQAVPFGLALSTGILLLFLIGTIFLRMMEKSLGRVRQSCSVAICILLLLEIMLVLYICHLFPQAPDTIYRQAFLFCLALSTGVLLLLLIGTIFMNVMEKTSGRVRWSRGVAICIVLLLPQVVLAWEVTQPWSWTQLATIRALDLPSGVSILLPLLLVMASLFVWAYFQLNQAWLRKTYTVTCPFPQHGLDPYFGKIWKKDEWLKNLTESQFGLLRDNWRVTSIAAVILGTGMVWVLRRRLPMIEGSTWDYFFHIAFVLLFTLCAYKAVRLYLVWSGLRDLLRDLAMTPLATAFSQIPEKARVPFSGYFFLHRPLEYDHLAIVGRKLREVVDSPNALAWALGSVTPKMKAQVKVIEAIGRPLAEKIEAQGSQANNDFIPLWDELSMLSCAHLVGVLQEFWKKRIVQQYKPEPIEAAEEVVAMHTVTYITQFIVYMRTHLYSLTICAVLLLLAVTSYPFQPEYLLLLPALTLCAAIAGLVLYLLVQMNQNEILSRITGSAPGFSFDWGFFQSIALYILPGASIIALQMSGQFRFILEPILRVLK